MMDMEQLNKIISTIDKIIKENSRWRRPIKYIIVKSDKSIMFFSHKPVVNKNNNWDISKFEHCFWEIIEYDNGFYVTEFADKSVVPSDFIGLPIDIPLDIDLLKKGLLKIKKQAEAQND